jgi:endoglucanase
MKNGFLLCTVFLISHIIVSAPVTVDSHIKVDQFGYRCTDQKIAVISNPQTGYNSGSPFTPGTTTNYQIKRWSDDLTVFSGALTVWNGGATDTQSGDKAWWFDFSALTTAGTYYVFDPVKNVGSYQFDIDDQVYANSLKHSMRMYYYQRCGMAISTPSAAAGWTHTACHIGSGLQQDTDCRLYNNQVAATSKNLSGGWHDAGDYNKYVNFAYEMVSNLLLAYEENPVAFTDNFGIPESGNGVPDILDEVKYELDWILKMQQADGSVLCMVGNKCSGTSGSTSPPSADANLRVYGPATTSASLTSASIFALAAIRFKALGIPAMTIYANTLQAAAINAYNWALANPAVFWDNNNGTCNIVSGNQEVGTYDIQARMVSAASFLYVLTGNNTYKTYFDANYSNIHLIQWSWVSPFEPTYNDALLYYSKGTSPTAAVVTDINNKFKGSMSGTADYLPNFTSSADPYRAYLVSTNYTWGSNYTKAKIGFYFTTMISYNLDAANNTNYKNAASGFMHYIHGLNPTDFMYLTNMGSYGAENSVNELFHSWYMDGSALWDRVGTSTYGPAPGYLTGGPNSYYSLDGCCPAGCGGLNTLCNNASVTPPLGQPVQKSYKDWNTSWPQDSWSVTEPSTGYQGGWIRLLSKFVGTGSCSILPVKLTSFTAIPQGLHTALLNWQTAEEKDNQKFIIERSADGIHFTEIGKVMGNGNSSSLQNYGFSDLNALEKILYYRLVQVDLNGSKSYSETRVVNFNDGSFIDLYPNPTLGTVTLEYEIQKSGNPISIKISDLSGKDLFRSSIPSNSGKLIMPLDLTHFPQGVYLVQFVTSERVYTMKIVKE